MGGERPSDACAGFEGEPGGGGSASALLCTAPRSATHAACAIAGCVAARFPNSQLQNGGLV